MAELKFTFPIIFIVIGMFSISLGQTGRELQQLCESYEMQVRIIETCHNGTLDACFGQPPSETHVCNRTYECQGMHNRFITLREKCTMICMLRRFSAKVPASRHWEERIDSLTYVRLESRNNRSELDGLRVFEHPVQEYQVYDFFSNIANMSIAKMTYLPRDCRDENANFPATCQMSASQAVQASQLCRQGTISLCRRDRYDLANNHCSRKYRCEGLTQDIRQDQARKCGILCWVFANAFKDFPHGNFPINQTTFDFTMQVKNSSSDSWDWKLYIVDAGLEEADGIFHRNFRSAFRNRTQFDVLLQVASRHCYLHNPSVCRDQDYLNYQVGRPLHPDTRPYCSFPSQLMSPYTRLVDSGNITLPSPNECSVWVQCDLTRYFQRHGWHRLPWCDFMDWMFEKTLAVLGLRGPDYEMSAIRTQLLLLNYGQDEPGGDYHFHWRNTTRQVRHLQAFYDDFTGSNGGYFATNFVVHAVFQDCLQRTHGLAQMRIQGRDFCPQSVYFTLNCSANVDGCSPSPGLPNSAYCSFRHAHAIEQKCTRLYWVIQTALFSNCSSEAHDDNPHLIVTIQVSDNGVVTARTLWPVLRDRVQPYIKNYVVNKFTSMSWFRIDAQFRN